MKKCEMLVVENIAVMVDCQFLFQGDTLMETEGSQDVLYMQISLQACRGSVCSLPHLASVTCAYLEHIWNSQLLQKMAPNKSVSSLNWETGTVWTSLSIDSSWDLYMKESRTWDVTNLDS
jgi:hypothetical protein